MISKLGYLSGFWRDEYWFTVFDLPSTYKKIHRLENVLLLKLLLLTIYYDYIYSFV